MVGLFHATVEELAEFHRVSSEETPEPYRQLLDHHYHMTVTVEAFHGGSVDVRVLASRHDGERYSRESLLLRQSDGAVVQLGIVRLHLAALSPEVRQEIEAGQTPLGRVLINHGVWRQVERHHLYRVVCGKGLSEAFSVPEKTTTYGRTALMYCDGEPAIELVEIVAPVPPADVRS